MNSNITLKSNIYINKTGSPGDQAFLQHITDYRILQRYNNYNDPLSYNGTAWLTPVQKKILDQGQPKCSLEKGTCSWGVPVGSDRFVCRCEEYACRYFERMCSKYENYEKVIRDETLHTLKMKENKPKEDADILPLFSRKNECQKLDIIDKNSNINQPTSDNRCVETQIKFDIDQLLSIGLNNSEETVPVAFSTDHETKMAITDHAEKKLTAKTNSVTDIENKRFEIVEQRKVIDALPSERIWVNAGPGTGKTYIVIQKIKKLLRENFNKTILVLCFSKNAVQVIKNRLKQELSGFHFDEDLLEIRTFDSFASYMLDDELDSTWNYNRRIEEFINMINRNKGALNDMIGYLIVDEIQDTVGVRARMLLTMLDDITCGVLLLGDRCQAIFDWAIRDEQDMSFSILTHELENRYFCTYELTGNHRQESSLALKNQELREIMLNQDETTQETAIHSFKEWVQTQWSTYNLKSVIGELKGTDDLILCKTNGEAAHISQSLFDSSANVPHIMKQSSDHRTLASWIAKVLHGNNGHILDKDSFIQNAIHYEIDRFEEKWQILKFMDKHPHAPGLHIPEVLSALSQNDGLSKECLNNFDDCVTVSTVHRAKGSEAEHIYWLDSPLVYEKPQNHDETLSDALKAAYVAVTRAKHDIHMLSFDRKIYMKSVNDKRWIQTGWGKNRKPFCKGIALLPGDIDECSFVRTDNAEFIQTIISNLEPGFPVDLYPNENKRCFEIYFDGIEIGQTSEKFMFDLFAGFDATNRNRNLPVCIKDAYITAITTVIHKGTGDIADIYRKAGCWLGFELGGFPNIRWY